MSGLLGGSVFAHNRGGNYVRNFNVPTDPQTAQQQTMRSAMQTLVTRWIETLTDAQREDWDTYAANVARLNRLGEEIYLTGQQWYIGANAPRIQSGVADLPIVDDGPTTFDRGTYTVPTVDSWTPATPSVDIAFEDTDVWLDEDDSGMLIFASRPMNATRNFFKGPFRYAGVILGDSVTPLTSPQTVTLPFEVAADQKVFLRALVSRADGRLSSEHVFQGIVA
ncbi:MAG: hypothetical protein M8857_01445 [marine benthic group bacterium]|nr:hypothetical protein [Gemmatimonadota bacterium]